MIKKLWQIFKNGCAIFTVITVLTYSVGTLLSTQDKAYIPTLKTLLIFLAFSLLVAFANRLLFAARLAFGVRLLLHFLACGALFFSVAVASGGFSASGTATLIAMTCYVLLYAVGAVTALIIRSVKSRRASDSKEYKGMFR